MIKLIIITLFAVAAVVAWVWIRHRRGLAQGVNKLSAQGRPPGDDSQTGLPTARITDREPKGYAPAQSREIVPTASETSQSASVPSETVEVAPSPLSPQPLAEPASTAPVEPVKPTPTLVDGIYPSSNETTPRKHDAMVCEFDQTEPGPASPPIASLRNEEAVALAEAPESEPSVPQTTTATPSADVTHVDETATQPGIADEKLTEIPASLDTMAASPPTTAPSSSDETESAAREGVAPPLAEDEPLPRARRYSEPKPSPTTKTSTNAGRKPDPTPRTDASLPIRLQLVFGRGGSVTMLSLVPNRREGMPSNIEVTAAHGRLPLSEWSADSYEPVSVSDVPDALSEGVVWQARGDAQRWRWELSKRELYVLAAGDEFGLRGFVTRRKDQRLWLNTRHVILAKESLRDQVLAALSEAGCATPEVSDSTTPGVPSGWILFRDVKPTRAVQRVGRAGRRESALSVALTLCRPRSHDDYYFQRPERITADPPPQPYVDLGREGILKRVLVKEVLRQAFAALQISTGGSESVHGEFGDAASWSQPPPGATGGPTVADLVGGWIQQNGAEIERVCDVLLTFAEPVLLNQRPSLLDWVRNGLVGEITAVAGNNQLYAQNALSERLANKGLLPMFGFPTRARLLYHSDPTRGFEWPPEDAVDRDLDIAISQFAPGAETVKDGIVHTAVGVAHYRRFGNRIQPEPNPLGADTPIATCRNCQAVSLNPAPGTTVCPVCQTPDFNPVLVTQPRGFRTLFDGGRDFDGTFEWTPRASRQKTDADTLPMTTMANVEFWSDERDVCTVNDNAGRLFQFERLANGESWVTRDAVDYAREQSRAPEPQFDATTAPRLVGLGSIKRTDILVLGLHNVRPELDLSPLRVESRAALYSFGFMLRRAVSVMLDINESELRVGLRVVRDAQGQVIGQIFLSDSLENGAGYCSQFANPQELERLLHFVADPSGSFLWDIIATHHADFCQTSCPDCLRDYANLAWHCILDWRLALDLARLALDSAALVDFTTPYWQPLVAAATTSYFNALGWAATTFGGLPAARSGSRAELIVHPLWANNHPTVLQAHAEATIGGISQFQPKTLFELVRRPF